MRSAMLSFTRSVERYVLEVYFGERRGIAASLVRCQLFFLSRVFAFPVRVRRFFVGSWV